MFNFGQKVIVNDICLKSYGRKGLFVGVNCQGQGKVYLETPIVTNKTTVSCVCVALEKIAPYQENSIEVLNERAQELIFKANQLKAQLKDIENELFFVEREILQKGIDK